MAAIKVSRAIAPKSANVILSPRITDSTTPTTKTTIQIPITSFVRKLDNSVIFFCNGVSSLLALFNASAILPTSVSMPHATTTALPLPYTTVEPLYNMFFLSPRVTSSLPCFKYKTSISLLTGTDSPVKAASSAFRECDSRIRQSAGTVSPASKTITSPTQISSLLTIATLPSLNTLEVDAVICIKASIAPSALVS